MSLKGPLTIKASKIEVAGGGCLRIEHGHVCMERVGVSAVSCSAEEAAPALVQVVSAASLIMKAGCSVSGSPACGLQVGSGASFSAHNTVISGSGSHNLQVSGLHSCAVLQDGCKLLGSKGAKGAFVCNGGSLVASNTVMSGNGDDNLEVKGLGSTAQLVGCKLTAAVNAVIGHGSAGAWVHEGASLHAKSSSFNSNADDGLCIDGRGSTVILDGCEFVGNGGNGINCGGGAEATATNTSIKGNSFKGCSIYPNVIVDGVGSRAIIDGVELFTRRATSKQYIREDIVGCVHEACSHHLTGCTVRRRGLKGCVIWDWWPLWCHWWGTCIAALYTTAVLSYIMLHAMTSAYAIILPLRYCEAVCNCKA